MTKRVIIWLQMTYIQLHSRPIGETTVLRSIFDIIQEHPPSVHCYADDTQLYVSFSPNDETGQTEAIEAMERCIEVIGNRMNDNKLLMNEDKTEFLLIGTRPQLEKVNV